MIDKHWDQFLRMWEAIGVTEAAAYCLLVLAESSCSVEDRRAAAHNVAGIIATLAWENAGPR